MNEFGLACKTILRNKTVSVLVILQLAITLTVVVNEYAAISQQVSESSRESGLLAEEDLFSIQSIGFANDPNLQAQRQTDLLLIRDTNGVVDGYATNSYPMSGNTWRTTMRTSLGDDAVSSSPAWYMVDEHALKTMGFTLLYGEYFQATDVVQQGIDPPKVLISQEVAASLFPNTPLENVVGKVIYSGASVAQTVIGIIGKLHGPSGNLDFGYHVMLQPQQPTSPTVTYFIRAESGMRDQVMETVKDKLAKSYQNRAVQEPVAFEDMRNEFFRGNMVLTWVLSTTLIVLLVIAGCGIVGLVSFTVQRQTKQIAIRRALGATIFETVSYYYVQYGVICIVGLLLGVAFAIPLNILFVEQFQFPKITVIHTIIATLAIFLVTMLGVSAPAIRASRIEPSIASRIE